MPANHRADAWASAAGDARWSGYRHVARHGGWKVVGHLKRKPELGRLIYDQNMEPMTKVTDVEDLRHPDAEKLLHTPDPARLAYNGRDGFPRVIPIGFWWNGTDIVVCTAPTAPKVKALGERPNVALTIDDIGPPAKALLVRGVARIEIVDGVAPEYLAAAGKSTSGDQLAAFEANVRALYKQMARITIAPKWARYYDFGAGRFPTFLRRLVDSTSG
jgi:hypothetical protein